MKNKLLFIGTLVMFTGIIFSYAACSSEPVATTTTSVKFSNWGVFGENVILPAKDFESRGLVFIETVFEAPAYKGIVGEVFTYQALLKEAAKVGADAIINVVIDKKIEDVLSSRGTISGSRFQERWYGSALAIKYTDMITDKDAHFNNARVFTGASGYSTVDEASRKR